MQHFIFTWLVLFVAVSASKADKLDDLIGAILEKHHVPGLSLAVIRDEEIARARGYGIADRERKTPVTPATLFQAGFDQQIRCRHCRTAFSRSGTFIFGCRCEHSSNGMEGSR